MFIKQKVYTQVMLTKKTKMYREIMFTKQNKSL